MYSWTVITDHLFKIKPVQLEWVFYKFQRMINAYKGSLGRSSINNLPLAGISEETGITTGPVLVWDVVFITGWVELFLVGTNDVPLKWG